jgi:hypothetical protein
MMIIPPTKSFYVVHVQREATDQVMEKLSPSTAPDIKEIIMISDDFPEDIQAQNEMDFTVKQLSSKLENITIDTIHNPLYIPASIEQIDEVLEADGEDNFRFIGMEGNPFTLKSTKIFRGNEDILEARVACHAFELPPYSEIIRLQENKVLN